MIFYELVAECHSELLLEEVVSSLLSREVQVQRSHFSNLNDWLQSSLLVQTPFGKSPEVVQYRGLPDGMKDMMPLGTSI